MITIAKELTAEDREKVTKFLFRMKSLIATHEYTIAVNLKNNSFDRQYSLREEEKQLILKSLEADDCVKIEPNNNPRYQAAEVFVFEKDVSVTSFGEIEELCLYIKVYIEEKKSYDIVIVISFHQSGMYD